MKIRSILPFTLMAIIMMVYPSTIMAQTVAVTGTITDTQTTPYSNGLLTVTFVNSTGQQATFGGNPSFQKSYAIYLDANGSFTISLPPNSTASPSIQPAGTQWNFSYQSQGGYGAANINVTITGAGSISGTLSNLARITWPYGNIPPPGAAGQGIVFVSSTTLGWGTTGTAGAVTHTAGNLTLNSMMLGNGVADAKIDTACVTNGTGALSGCSSISTTGNVIGANLPPALPTTPNGVSFIDTSTPAGGIAVAPAWSWPGVPINEQTGTSYTIAPTDRSGIVTGSNVGATAWTLPQAGSTNFANNFNFGGCNINTGLITITPTVSTLNGAATGIVPNHWCIFGYSNNTNYRAGTFADIAAYPNCVDSAGNHLNFTSATGAFSCGTSSSGAGTVTTTGSPASSYCAYFSAATSIIGTANCTLDSSGNLVAAGNIASTAGSIYIGNSAATTILGILRSTGTFETNSTGVYRFYNNANISSGSPDTGLSRGGAGTVAVGSGNSGDVTGKIQSGAYLTGTNCSSSASPAVCGSAAAGSVAVPTGVTPTLVVNTTAVTANSQILFTPDESLGTKLGVTCNSTIAQVAIEPIVTARTAATSFTIQYNTTITVNPICLSYFIVN